MPSKRTLPDGLVLNHEQLEVFYGMCGEVRRAFDKITDNRIRLVYIQGILDHERSIQERPVCLFKDIFFVINGYKFSLKLLFSSFVVSYTDFVDARRCLFYNVY